MPSYVRVNGTYKKIKEIFYKDSGSYREIRSAYNKYNDSYEIVHAKGMIPDGAIAVFLNEITAESGWVREVLGDNLPAQNDTFPGSKQATGAATHNHGSASVTSSTNTHTINLDYRTVGSNGYVSTVSSHKHTLASHTHPDTATNYPLCKRAAHYQNVKYVVADMVIFSRTALEIDTDEWETVSFPTSRNLCFSDSSAGTDFGESSTHTHGNKTLNSSTFSTSYASDTYLRGYYWNRAHYHTVVHRPFSITLLPYYRDFYVYKAKIDFAEIPSSSWLIGHYTMTSAPAGWTLDTGSNERFIRMVSPGSTLEIGGADNSAHNHGGTNLISETDVRTLTFEGDPAPNEKYSIPNHNHTWAHSHPSADARPPRVKYPFIIKD